MPIIKSKNGYKGTFDVYEPNFPPTFVENKSRKVVEWDLRREFADRLEQAARDAALIRHLLDGVKWEWIEDDAVRTRGEKLLQDLATNLSELRDVEPSLVLCADRDGSQVVTLDDGSKVDLDFGDWTSSHDALVARKKRAWIDSEAAFAASDAIEALDEAGIRGPKTAATADYLGEDLVHHFVVVHHFVDAARVKGQPLDDNALQKLAESHVRVVVKLAKTNLWTDYEDETKQDACWGLLREYREQIERELMSPAQRAAVDKRAERAMRRVQRAFAQHSQLHVLAKVKTKRGKKAA
jgi:hypothetical protein